MSPRQVLRVPIAAPAQSFLPFLPFLSFLSCLAFLPFLAFRPTSLTLRTRPWILQREMNVTAQNTLNTRWWWRHF